MRWAVVAIGGTFGAMVGSSYPNGDPRPWLVVHIGAWIAVLSIELWRWLGRVPSTCPTCGAPFVIGRRYCRYCGMDWRGLA